jgi:hypothetical protein
MPNHDELKEITFFFFFFFLNNNNKTEKKRKTSDMHNSQKTTNEYYINIAPKFVANCNVVPTFILYSISHV